MRWITGLLFLAPALLYGDQPDWQLPPDWLCHDHSAEYNDIARPGICRARLEDAERICGFSGGRFPTLAELQKAYATETPLQRAELQKAYRPRSPGWKRDKEFVDGSYWAWDEAAGKMVGYNMREGKLANATFFNMRSLREDPNNVFIVRCVPVCDEIVHWQAHGTLGDRRLSGVLSQGGDQLFGRLQDENDQIYLLHKSEETFLYDSDKRPLAMTFVVNDGEVFSGIVGSREAMELTLQERYRASLCHTDKPVRFTLGEQSIEALELPRYTPLANWGSSGRRPTTFRYHLQDLDLDGYVDILFEASSEGFEVRRFVLDSHWGAVQPRLFRFNPQSGQYERHPQRVALMKMDYRTQSAIVRHRYDIRGRSIVHRPRTGPVNTLHYRFVTQSNRFEVVKRSYPIEDDWLVVQHFEPQPEGGAQLRAMEVINAREASAVVQ